MTGQSRPSCRVAVAILNWNGEAHLRRFLPSVVAHRSKEDLVVVIDNGSDDGSLSLLASEFDSVEVVALPENSGFAGGYNAGLELLQQRVDADWFLLLNSDVAVTEGWVDVMVDACVRERWSAAQPKIRSVEERSEFEYAGAAGGYMDRHGFMFCAGRIFDAREEDLGQYDTDRAVFWASGAAMLVRSEAWREVEGLDVDFFAHMEEIDLCWRLRNRGHVVGVATGTHVYHLGGGTLAQSSPRKAFFNFRNNLYLLLKNDHRPGVGRRIIFRQLLDGLAAIRFLTQGNWGFFKAVIRAHSDFRRNRAAMVVKRESEMKACPRSHSAQAVRWGTYKGSILVEYFLKGRRKWTDLPSSGFH